MLRRGEGLWLTANDWATAVLYNGLGRYEDALAAAEEAARDPHEPRPLDVGRCPSSIEAAARSGKPERAAGPLARLAEIAEANGTDWALGCIEARAALLADGAAAEQLYREAIERLARTRIRVASSPARTSSTASGCAARTAASTRASSCAPRTSCSREMGNEAFAERARRELLATGETVRKRSVETLDELTPQEAQIARLAADGLHEPGDRRPAVPQPAHRRVAPAQGVREARHHVPQGAALRVARRHATAVAA